MLIIVDNVYKCKFLDTVKFRRCCLSYFIHDVNMFNYLVLLMFCVLN